jgi:hypothetical protein
MRIKIVFPFITLVTLVLVIQNPSYSVPTRWERIETSMEELLNKGWQIMSYNSNRAATSPGASGYRNYDTTNFTYLLTKNGKYITCILRDPSPPEATDAGCRKLN